MPSGNLDNFFKKARSPSSMIFFITPLTISAPYLFIRERIRSLAVMLPASWARKSSATALGFLELRK